MTRLPEFYRRGAAAANESKENREGFNEMAGTAKQIALKLGVTARTVRKARRGEPAALARVREKVGAGGTPTLGCPGEGGLPNGGIWADKERRFRPIWDKDDKWWARFTYGVRQV